MRNPAKFLFSLAFIGIISAASAVAAPKLDIGADYRIRGIAYENPTFASEPPPGSGNTTQERYYSHRARTYIKGKFDPSIEIGVSLQALGIAGSTEAVLNRYPSEDFSPFIENAYVTTNEIFGWPVNATFGRQPYVWGNGMILSDDGLGFDGISFDVGPFWGSLRGHFLTAKVRDKKIGEGNSDIYLFGTSYQWGIHNIKLGYIVENDNTGQRYTSLVDTTPVTVNSDKINRQFIDLQVSGNLEKGAYYNAEFAFQRGKVNLPGNALVAGRELTLSGRAINFEGGFDFYHPRYKRMILAFVFMEGSGNDFSTDKEDERFAPSFGHKYDGLEPVGRGDFFAATPYSFYRQDTAIFRQRVGDQDRFYPLSSVVSGLRTFGFKGSVSPIDGFTAGMEFYLYTAIETADLSKGNVANTKIDSKSLGREFVISTSYLYMKRVNFALRWGKYFASPLTNDVGAWRLMFEVGGRF